jgi:signal transduction histidine kinase
MKAFLRHRSIAFRLIVAVLTVEAIAFFLVAVLSYAYESHVQFSSFEVMLRGRADSVLGAVQDAEDVADNLILDQGDLHVPAEDIWQVEDGNGRILGRSPNWQGPTGDHESFWRRGYLNFHLHHRHYLVLMQRGIRTIDPYTTGGGKVWNVSVYYGAPLDRVWEAMRGTVYFIAAASLTLLAISGSLIAWLLHRGLSPLRQLAELASKVSANSWQFEPPPIARETPELAPLTLAIESVLGRLERAFMQQRTFVSDAAHELKTAVAVIKSSIQVLNLRSRTETEYQEGLERCLSDTERIEELVAKMLTLARVENGEEAIGHSFSCDLVSILRETADRLSTLAAVRGVQINIGEPTSGSIVVPLSAEDASILISNVLLNALQHSPADSLVESQLITENDQVRLFVRDHGEGIDAAILPHIFDRFYRGDPSRARSTGGAGLGLTICKAIVNLCSGSVVIHNDPDGGAVVCICLPLAGEESIKTCEPSA